jgi:hypothetical protein
MCGLFNMWQISASLTRPCLTSLNCGTWYQSGNYVGCCSTTSASCNTGFIYGNIDDSNPCTDIFCGIFSLNWSYYRVIPTSTTTSSSPPSTSAHRPHTTTTTLPYLYPRLKSTPWIAGVVVGPIFLLSLVGLGIVRLDYPTQKASERGSGSGSFEPAAAASVVCAVSAAVHGWSGAAVAAGRADEGHGTGSWAAAICGGAGGREVSGRDGRGKVCEMEFGWGCKSM